MTTLLTATPYVGDVPADGKLLIHRIGEASGESVEVSQLSIKQIVNADVTITVGSGGDYSTVNDALKYITDTYQTGFNISGTKTVELSLLTGFVWEEQVWIDNMNLSYITITSVDAEVVVDRASLTITPLVRYGTHFSPTTLPFLTGFRSFMPFIDVLFNMNTTGVAGNQTGISCAHGQCNIAQGGGVKNATHYGLHAFNANLDARVCDFSNAGKYGILLSTSMANLDYTVCTGAGEIGAYITGASRVRGESMDADGAGVAGYQVTSSFADLNNSHADNCGAGSSLYVVGSFVNASGFSGDNCTNSLSVYYGSHVGVKNGSFDGDSNWGIVVSSSLVSAEGTTASGTGGGFYLTNGATVYAGSSTGTSIISFNTVTSAGLIHK